MRVLKMQLSDLLVDKITPIISAIIAGVFSYLLTRQKNENVRLEKEYKYLDIERLRLQKYFKDELKFLREEKKTIYDELNGFGDKLKDVEEKEEDCQQKLELALKLIQKLKSQIDLKNLKAEKL